MATINLNHITKIEGHANLELKIDKNKVKTCRLQTTEGARFFEGLLEKRHYEDAPEMTSRICGICSAAHIIASIEAIEDAFGVKVSEQTEKLRLVLTIGERIRSHASHLYLFSLPDYLGYESAIAMAAKYKKQVMQAFELIKLGNDIVTAFAGRIMHGHTFIVGGVTGVPSNETIKQLSERLKKARTPILDTIKLFGSLKIPKFDPEMEFLSLKRDDFFALHHGRICSSTGAEFDKKIYTSFIKEEIEDYAVSKFAKRDHGPYMVGSLPRINNNLDKIDKEAIKLVEKNKIKFPSNNPFLNNFAQAIEMLHWQKQLIDIFENNKFRYQEPVEIRPKHGRGVGVVEAPRGIDIHDYEIDNQGNLEWANIIPPTTQNLRSMEYTITEYVNQLLSQKRKLSKENLVLEIEKLIRAYDPCISCSTHFLNVKFL